jgi:hypothetical protein
MHTLVESINRFVQPISWWADFVWRFPSPMVALVVFILIVVSCFIWLYFRRMYWSLFITESLIVVFFLLGFIPVFENKCCDANLGHLNATLWFPSSIEREKTYPATLIVRSSDTTPRLIRARIEGCDNFYIGVKEGIASPDKKESSGNNLTLADSREIFTGVIDTGKFVSQTLLIRVFSSKWWSLDSVRLRLWTAPVRSGCFTDTARFAMLDNTVSKYLPVKIIPPVSGAFSFWPKFIAFLASILVLILQIVSKLIPSPGWPLQSRKKKIPE